MVVGNLEAIYNKHFTNYKPEWSEVFSSSKLGKCETSHAVCVRFFFSLTSRRLVRFSNGNSDSSEPTIEDALAVEVLQQVYIIDSSLLASNETRILPNESNLLYQEKKTSLRKMQTRRLFLRSIECQSKFLHCTWHS